MEIFHLQDFRMQKCKRKWFKADNFPNPLKKHQTRSTNWFWNAQPRRLLIVLSLLKLLSKFTCWLETKICHLLQSVTVHHLLQVQPTFTKCHLPNWKEKTTTRWCLVTKEPIITTNTACIPPDLKTVEKKREELFFPVFFWSLHTPKHVHVKIKLDCFFCSFDGRLPLKISEDRSWAGIFISSVASGTKKQRVSQPFIFFPFHSAAGLLSPLPS